MVSVVRQIMRYLNQYPLWLSTGKGAIYFQAGEKKNYPNATGSKSKLHARYGTVQSMVRSSVYVDVFT